ncbi:MAG: sugar transporter [Bacteroidia bacterium]|nr:sugar transporter [Bacteroidia bacterium]
MKQILCLFVLISSFAFAQEKMKVINPVKWNVTYSLDDKNSSDVFVILTATIDKEWHIYSQKVGNAGPVATSFTFDKDSLKYSTSGETVEPAGEKKLDPAFDAEIVSFTGTVVFTQRIKRVKNIPIKITGNIEYMTCNNMQCYPPKTVPFSIEIP